MVGSFTVKDRERGKESSLLLGLWLGRCSLQWAEFLLRYTRRISDLAEEYSFLFTCRLEP